MAVFPGGGLAPVQQLSLGVLAKRLEHAESRDPRSYVDRRDHGLVCEAGEKVEDCRLIDPIIRADAFDGLQGEPTAEDG